MRKPKIDLAEMERMVNEGKTHAEIAKHFEVTPAAVTHAAKKLGTAVAKSNLPIPTTVADGAKVVIRDANDAKGELTKLIQQCQDEVYRIKQSVANDLSEDTMKWKETALKHITEMRRNITALADIEYKLHHVEVVQKALLVMLEEIKNESPDCQRRIADRLKAARILFLSD